MYAIVRMDEAEFDIGAVSKDLADQLCLNAVDLAQQFSKSPGVLFDSVSADEAEDCLRVLRQHGLEVERLRQSKIVEPETRTISRCKLLPEGLQHGSKVTPWEEIRWVDLAYIATRTAVPSVQDGPLSRTYAPDDSFFGEQGWR